MPDRTGINRRNLVKSLITGGAAAAVNLKQEAVAQTVTTGRPNQPAKTRVLFLAPDGFNDKLVYRYLDDMPHVRRILAEGYSARVLPFASTWGNINFLSMVTGASPGIHYGDGNACHAETLWKTLAANQRKSVMFNFPPAAADHSDLIGVVACGGAGATVTLFPAAVHQTPDVTTGMIDETVVQRTGWPPGGGPEEGRNVRVMAAPAEHNGRLETSIRLTDDVVWQAIPGPGRGVFDQVQIFREGETSPAVTATRDGWSSWVAGEARGRPFSVRFRLLQIASDGSSLQLASSAGCPASGFARPETLESLLHSGLGPYAYRSGIAISPEDPFHQAGLEELLDAELWVADAFETAMDSWNADFCMFKGALADSANHQCATKADPSYYAYQADTAVQYDRVMRTAYAATDRVIGRLLAIAERRNDTHVVIAGDHGICVNNIVCDINRRLQDAGLLAVTADGVIDWTRSLAYTRRTRQGNDVYVNLKDREPHGIVPAGDYAGVQDRIIDTLLDWRDPDGKQRAIAYALRKRDAQMIGYWGEHAGDVTFAYNPGFTWGVNPDGATTAPYRSGLANHGAGIPTQEAGISSNMGLLLAWGPKVSKGMRRDADRFGPVTTAQIGPTLAGLLGCRPPAQSDAGVIRDLFK